MRFKLKILIDTREKENKNIHIRKVLEDKGVEYSREKLEVGDYTAVVIFEDGKTFDLRNEIVIERKHQLAEISNNLTKNNGERFIKELDKIKANNIKMNLLIEDDSWYEHLMNSNYMPELMAKDEAYAKRYNPKHRPELFIGKLLQLKHKYDFEISGIKKEYTASYIYRYLWGYVRQNSYRMYREAKSN